ncbi:MAG TPA: pilus assembly protein TadG-related protein [Candidatus Acidoferrum sp.]|nr:pilus assembly protein TadG-related protein [Candidatus Acidoferrum sp.]
MKNKIAAKKPRGQVMVLICVSLVALMGMVAVVTDFSFMQHQKNMMQTAADSAAMAAAEELNYGDQVAAGKADAATNGYTDGASSVTVAINSPPSSGPNTANSGYVEAIVSRPEPTYFLRVLGVNTMTVSTRAVAYEGNGPNCIYVMDPTASGALAVNGDVTIASSCGLLVDSSSSSGLMAVGNVTVTAPDIGVVGNYTSTGNVSFSPTPKIGAIAATDPLASIQEPTVGSCAHTSFSLNGNSGSSSAPYQLYPGTYCGGISIHGNAVLHFNAGTYVLAGGGMNISANTTMTGTGVTFYNTTGTGGYGPITLNGNTTANLSAPTSGPLAGMLFFQDRTVPNTAAGSTISGNATSTFDGAIYFPTTTVTFNGNSSANGYSIVVADQLTVSGNASIGSNYSSLTNGSPIKSTILAE